MVLLFVFLLLVLVLFALFLGGGLVAQGYLYQAPAERMPLRAVAAAVLVSGFVTFWVWLDQRAPGRYETFFNFDPSSTVDFQEFEAVRWMGSGDKLKLDASGNPTETTVKFKRSGKASPFVEEGTNDPFKLNGSTAGGAQFMTGAIRVKAPDDSAPVRYNAVLKEDERTKRKAYTPERKFVEENGSRFVEVEKLGTLVVPSTRTIVVSLLLNLALMAVWLAAIWPVLRFSLGHAVVFAGSLGIITMLTVMPVLFKQVRMPKGPAPATTGLIAEPDPSGRSNANAQSSLYC